MPKQFSDLGISAPILKAINELNFAVPTEIQQKTIPLLLSNTTDLVGLAKTGTGKTAAFGLPILQLIDTNLSVIQAVILVPTRELGQQIFNNLESFAKFLPEVSIAATCGGIPIKPQIERLSLPTHIVVATPGRLIDLIQRKAINLKETRFLVLDEADEMVTILKEGLDEIIAELPTNHNTFLFSATMPGTIKQLIQNYLNKNVVQVSANMETVGNQGIDHEYIVVDPIEKLDVLMHFLNTKEGERGIIFCKTKKRSKYQIPPAENISAFLRTVSPLIWLSMLKTNTNNAISPTLLARFPYTPTSEKNIPKITISKNARKWICRR